MEVGGQDFYIDLLLYHLKLRCYVVIELKACDFEPGFISQLNMYQNAVNDILRHPDDKPTIGLLLVEGKNVTKYTLFAVKYRNSYVLLNLQMANKVLQEQLHRRFFSSLGKRGLIDVEKRIAGYKTDLFIRDTNILVEIKTVIDTKREVYFPSVRSERSLQQLNKIGELLEKGNKFCFIFVALSPSIKEIRIDKHSSFYESFQCCVNKGLRYIGCSLKTTRTEISVRGLIEVKL